LHGVAVPEQLGTPEPGPVLPHHPFSLHVVPEGQLESSRHFDTQMCAPMHIVWLPYAPVQSASVAHSVVHWWWAIQSVASLRHVCPFAQAALSAQRAPMPPLTSPPPPPLASAELQPTKAGTASASANTTNVLFQSAAVALNEVEAWFPVEIVMVFLLRSSCDRDASATRGGRTLVVAL
jgi:hypothetical protein